MFLRWGDDAPEQAWAGRTAGMLLLLGGTLNLIGLILPTAAEADPARKLLASGLGLAVGVMVMLLPWGKWPARRTSVLIPVALGLMMLNKLTGPATSVFPNYFVLTFVWIGLWQPRWTSVRWMVPAAAAYLVPLLLKEASAAALTSTALVVPTWVVVGETMGWVSGRFRDALERNREGDSLLDAALDSVADGVLLVDRAGRIEAQNSRFAEMWRIPPELVAAGDDDRTIAFVLEQLVEPAAFVAKIRALYAEPEAESFDVLRFKDGRVFERVSRPQRMAGESVGRVWSFRDVTERVRTEEALRAQADELSALHDTTLGLLDEVDAGGLLQTIVERAAALMHSNDAWVYVVDAEADELVVTVGTGIFSDNLGYRLPKGEGLAGRVWETGQTLAVEDYGRWSGGRPEYAHLRAVVGTPLFVRGEVIGVIGVVTQLEDRHFTEEEQELLFRFGQMASLALHHARLLDAAQNEVAERTESERVLAESLQREHHAAEELRRVNEMKNAFLTAVSHELRTPLTSVVGFSDTLQRWNATLTADERMVMLDRLSRNARKLDRLLTDLLDVDRLTRGILKPSLKNTDVGGLVRAVVENAEFLEGRPVHVSAPSMVLKVDGPKVERIVENLLANAVRYTSELTDIWVNLTRVPEGILLVVEDAGNGIPPSVQESIFEPFQQGPEKVEHSPGVGIGLSLVFRFAEMHRGRAWVQERPGGGASFRVLLPEPTATIGPPPVPPERVRVSR